MACDVSASSISISKRRVFMTDNVYDQPAATDDRPFQNTQLRRSVASFGSSLLGAAMREHGDLEKTL